MIENAGDPLEMMLLECIDEIQSLKYRYRKVIPAHRHYSMFLNQQQTVARKLLHGYRHKTIDEDVIISAFHGVTQFVGRITEDLESVEKELRGNRIPIFFRKIIEAIIWFAKKLK